MPNIVRRKDKRGKIYYWNKKTKKFSSEAKYKRSKKSYTRSSTGKKSKKGVKKMARGNGSSYSKANIGLGVVAGAIAPKVLKQNPNIKKFLPLVSLLPKVPTSLKVMGWSMASKTLSDIFMGRE